MICKEAILNYERLKSIKAGLLHKAGRLEALLNNTEPGLFDKLLFEYNSTLEIIRAREKEISGLEKQYKFLKTGGNND